MSSASRDYGAKFGTYPSLGDNGPLRGWLGELYDGSLRTPAFVNWPGVLEPRVVTAVVSVLDWYPTLSTLVGRTPAKELGLEGRDVWPLLEGRGAVETTELYWKTSRGAAVRHGKWKLVVHRRPSSLELFRMDLDPHENKNVSLEFPDQVKRLQELLERHRALDPK